jgi:hypothetical protein
VEGTCGQHDFSSFKHDNAFLDGGCFCMGIMQVLAAMLRFQRADGLKRDAQDSMDTLESSCSARYVGYMLK